MQWTLAIEYFNLGKKAIVLKSLLRPENPIFLLSTHAADHMIDMLRVVT